MPQHRRFRRFRRSARTTTAVTAVSAGAAAVLILGAGPAQADPVDLQKGCRKGVDPGTTLENWRCQFDNFTRQFSPKPTTAPAKPTRGTAPRRSTAPRRAEPKAPASRPSGGGPSAGAPPSGGSTTYSTPNGMRPYSPGGSAPILPTPQVAADPSRTVHGSRLVAPAAAAETRQDAQLPWVAAAAGLAGAVGALNLSVAGRRRRRAAE